MMRQLWATLEYVAGHEEQHVVVYFGDEFIANLPPVTTSRAGHGDDSTYFKSEDERIVDETVAPYLRRVFDEDRL